MTGCFFYSLSPFHFSLIFPLAYLPPYLLFPLILPLPFSSPFSLLEEWYDFVGDDHTFELPGNQDLV